MHDYLIVVSMIGPSEFGWLFYAQNLRPAFSNTEGPLLLTWINFNRIMDN